MQPATGLTAAEAAERLRHHGPNRIAEGPRAPAWRRLLAQFRDLMVLVLLGAAGVSLGLGEVADGAAVLVIVVVNAILGFVQESRAERSLEALRRLSAPMATVRRDGREVSVPAEAVVPGDILVLEAGDRVAADARLLEAASLAAEESAITGESRPVAKTVSVAHGPGEGSADVPTGDRRNVVFQGSHVTRGRATAVVFATGMATEVGRIARLIAGASESRTPLQRRLDGLGRWLVIGCLLISAVVVVAGVLQGEPPYRMFLTGVSLAVAAIPEGLPAIVTIALALGVQRMIARNAIVRHLPAVETLGCATVICADKTGTLTQNAMAVQVLYAGGLRYAVSPGGLTAEGCAAGEGGPGRGGLARASTARSAAAASSVRPAVPPAVAACVRVAVLCNNAPATEPPDGRAADDGAVFADPTEAALVRLAESAGLSAADLRTAYPRRAEVPFESERRRMTVVCAGQAGPLVLVKGALEEVLARCAWVATDRGCLPLDARWTAAIRREGEAMAAGALRVLALAERPLAGDDRAARPSGVPQAARRGRERRAAASDVPGTDGGGVTRRGAAAATPGAAGVAGAAASAHATAASAHATAASAHAAAASASSVPSAHAAAPEASHPAAASAPGAWPASPASSPLAPVMGRAKASAEQSPPAAGGTAAAPAWLPPAPTPAPTPPLDELERGLTFCGLAGLMDPPRPEVPAAIRRCHQAGIRAVMITGDHALTARAVAERIGLLQAGGRVLTGRQLSVLGDRELLAAVDDVGVYARVSPADKLRVVRALRARGHVVAMTGDGVNDAPAVKEADIGVAMGRAGTDVTREASALVLMDDNFATIVAAVEEGRSIYDNIRKFIRYLLACNTGEVLVMLGGTLLGLPLPLLPLQLLLVNLVTDGLPALALGLDPPSRDVMRRPPRPPRESVFAGGLGKRIAVRGLLIGAFALGAFAAMGAAGGGVAEARTAAACTLVLCQLLHAFEARAERRSIWEIAVLANRPLVAAVASSLAILGAVLYVPPLRALFGFAPPGGWVWGTAALASAACSLLAGVGETARRAWVRRTALVRLQPRGSR